MYIRILQEALFQVALIRVVVNLFVPSAPFLYRQVVEKGCIGNEWVNSHSNSFLRKLLQISQTYF